MGIFSDVLLSVDYDRTLTAPDSTIPQQNLEAIQYYMDNGGAFTVNTGRSRPLADAFLSKVPVNGPVLMYNGAAAFDPQTGEFPILHPIPMEQADTIRRVMAMCPEFITEVHALDAHYTFLENPAWEALYDALGCIHRYAQPGDDLGPFLKMSICGPFTGTTLRDLFCNDPAYVTRYDALEAQLREVFGNQLSVLRAAPQIIDLQSAAVNKGTAARELAQKMGRNILVCVGDERNDIDMLNLADYAFCPGDARIAGQYENVCPCGEGAVADVIYKKIPGILGKQP